MDNVLKEIRDFVKANSSFTDDNDGDDETNELEFSTRQHGNVGEGAAGEKDIREAIELTKKIEAKWPGVQADWEEVDEWVMINVTA
jgi:hypothetical protein